MAISGQIRPHIVQPVHSSKPSKTTKWLPFSLKFSESKINFLGQVEMQSWHPLHRSWSMTIFPILHFHFSLL
jgi:hypothetical protein